MWPVFAAYGAVLAWLLVVNLVLVGATGGAVVSPGILVASLTINAASLVAAALLGAHGGAGPPGARLRTGPGRLGAGAGAVAVIGLLALSQALDSLLTLLGLRESGALGFLDQLLRETSGLMALLLLLVAGLLAPAAEELFFRGFVQTRLAEAWSPGPAVGVTALAFGLMHLDPAHAGFALVIGLYLGWLTELAASIRPAIAAHVANNVVSLGQTWLLPPPASAPVQTGLLAGHFLLTAGVVPLLRRGRGAGSGKSASPGASS